MALQSVKGFVSWPPETSFGWSGYTGGVIVNFALTAATEKVAFVFVPPIAGGNLTVTDIAILIGAYTSTGNLDVRLETVGTDGNPTGTLVGTNTNAVISVTATGIRTVTLTASASLTAGTAYAVVCAYSSGNYSIGTYNCDAGNRTVLVGGQMIYLRYFTAAAWSNGSTHPSVGPIMALKLSGGAYANLPGMNGYSAINRTTFNNTTTVRKRGAALTPRFAGTVCGWAMWAGGLTASDFTIELRTTAGSLLASWVADKDRGNYYGGGGVNYSSFTRGYFDATVNVTAGTTYDLLLVPTSATNMQINTASIINADANSIQAFPGGADNIQVEIDNASARTTDATKWPIMSLLFSSLDDGAAGGASSPFAVGMSQIIPGPSRLGY